MDSGIKYDGLVSNTRHERWLNNLTDRAAISSVTNKASQFFDSNIADSTQEYFEEVISLLDQREHAEETFIDA